MDHDVIVSHVNRADGWLADPSKMTTSHIIC